MPQPKPEYLGDGLYVDVESGMLRLYTSSNVIYLEPEVFEALLDYGFKLWPRTDHNAE